jgi:hypothetical protein
MSVINNGSEDEEHVQYEELVKKWGEENLLCVTYIQVTRAQNLIFDTFLKRQTNLQT